MESPNLMEPLTNLMPTKNSNTHGNFPTTQMPQTTNFLKSYAHL